MQSSTEAPKLTKADYVWAATRRLTVMIGGGPSGRYITVRYDYRDTERGLAIPIADETCPLKSDNIEAAMKRAVDELRHQETGE